MPRLEADTGQRREGSSGAQGSEGSRITENDDDSEVDEFGLRHLKVLLDRPTPISNSFQALAEDQVDDGIDNETLDMMNKFAHHVQIGRKSSQRAKKRREDFSAVIKEFQSKDEHDRRQPIILRTCDDLDRADVRRVISPLPDSPAEIDRLAALCPTHEEEPLLQGQRWVLFDTGASCSALKVSRDCPQYLNHVRPTKNSLSGKGAESANGGSITERGEVEVDMIADQLPCRMAFRDMDVSMPIASGRACVASDDTLAIIHRASGMLKNVVTGKEVRLYARQGVYFFKGTFLNPGAINEQLSPLFVRQG